MCSLNYDLVRIQIGHRKLHRQIVIRMHVRHLINIYLGTFMILMALALVLLVVAERFEYGATDHAFKETPATMTIRILERQCQARGKDCL